MKILATWLIEDLVKIHVANYLRKAFHYTMDYPRGEIGMWVSYHAVKSPCEAKIQVFLQS
jgi:hypothetical protein